MHIPSRGLLIASSLALLAAGACGGGPTAPSRTSGAIVAGTVTMNGVAASRSSARAPSLSGARAATASRSAAATSAASGLVVTIAGTSLSAAIDGSGYFQIGSVPPGHVRLQFHGQGVSADAELADVAPEELIDIEVEISGNTASIVSEQRSTEKVSLCHRTDTGTFNLISVSVNAEPAHLAHGDGRPNGPVPGSTTQTFDAACRLAGPAVRIEKSTNGEDADRAPGPTVIVGEPVTWTYVVTNIGTLDLTNVTVTDDQNLVVTCPGTALPVGQSMTCTADGVAVEGQYANIGTVTADSTAGPVTDSDPSHYFGRTEDDGPKVQLCHRTGTGRYIPISVSVNAEPAHRAHGDGKVGEAVPGSSGAVFGVGCAVN